VNIKEYIESGILEAYALDSLPPDEAKEVVANLVRYPELQQELEKVENALTQYAVSFSQAPPPDLEDKIWNTIQAGNEDKVTSNVEKEGPRVIPFPSEGAQPTQWKFAAAVAVLVGSVAMNVILWNKDNKSSVETASLITRVDSMNNRQHELALLLDGYRKAKDMMSDTDMQTIVMHTMQKGHAMAATLYWSKSKGEAYVSVDGLPAPPPGMQYQLWAIKDGKPVDMGVLPNDMANTPSMKKVGMPVNGGDAFAISLEKSGGSPVPTMENIYVLGKA
jgi:hypothetical protein